MEVAGQIKLLKKESKSELLGSYYDFNLLQPEEEQHLILTNETYSNEGCFLERVNGDKEGYANCKALMLNVDQEPRIFVETVKNVEKGDLLYLFDDSEQAHPFKYIKNVRKRLNHFKKKEKKILEETVSPLKDL